MLYNMGFQKSGKHWPKEEEGDSDNEDDGTKKGKRKASYAIKGKAPKKSATSPCKSSRLAKGKNIISVIDEEDLVFLQIPAKPTEVEDRF